MNHHLPHKLTLIKYAEVRDAARREAFEVWRRAVLRRIDVLPTEQALWSWFDAGLSMRDAVAAVKMGRLA